MIPLTRANLSGLLTINNFIKSLDLSTCLKTIDYFYFLVRFLGVLGLFFEICINIKM